LANAQIRQSKLPLHRSRNSFDFRGGRSHTHVHTHVANTRCRGQTYVKERRGSTDVETHNECQGSAFVNSMITSAIDRY